MNRIILGMAGANYLLVAATAVAGLLSETPATGFRSNNDAFGYHFTLGLLTGLFTMLVHCLVFTYFLGTTRWVRETVAAYSLDQAFSTESRQLRIRAMIAAVISILLVVATIASGAAAHTRVAPFLLHRIVPWATYLFMLGAYRIELQSIERHMDVTNEVMDSVAARRAALGLPPLPVE